MKIWVKIILDDRNPQKSLNAAVTALENTFEVEEFEVTRIKY